MRCEKCVEELNSWDKRVGKMLGYRLCENCIAQEYSITVDEFRDKMENFLGLRPCQGL